jgi:sporulation protein YlmC with PRC-barrel domain
MRKLSILTAFIFALSLVLTGTALAAGERQQQRDQQQMQQQRDQQRMQQQRGAAVQPDQKVHRASEIIGSNIENRQGENLGEIEDLVVDPATGRISYAVLSYGGVLGVGDRRTAVPFTALNPKPDDPEKLVLNIERQRLEQAPSFESREWTELNDPNYTRKVDQFFQQQGRDMRESPRTSPTTR